MEAKNEDKKSVLKDSFWLTVGIIYAVFFLGEAIFLHGYQSNIFGFNWNWGWAVFFFQITYTGLCFKRVGNDDWGALLFFGKPIKQLSPGPAFAPWPFITFRHDTKLTIQLAIPGKPEEIEMANQDNPAPGKVPPLRIPHSSLESAIDLETGKLLIETLSKEQIKAMAADPFNQRLTSEVIYYPRFRISDYKKFLTTIGSVKEASKQIGNVTVTTGLSIMTKITQAQTLANLDGVALKIRDSLDILVGEVKDKDRKNPKDPWGIDAEDVGIVLNTGRRVNVASADAASAGFNKKEVILKAEGEAEGEEVKRTRKGRGDANAKQALLEAKAKGMEALAKAMKDDAGKLAFHLDVVQTALEHAQYSIFSGVDPMASIAAIHEIWRKVVSPDEKKIEQNK